MVTKHKRSDSAAVAVQAMKNAALGFNAPPAYITLRPGDEPFWPGIIGAKAHDEWTDAHLVVAAQLCRTMSDLEKEQTLMDTEGTVLENARGTPVMNPRVTVLEGLARREMALMRTLGLSGKLNVDPRHAVGKRKIEQQSRKLREELEDDPLLA